MNPVLSTVAQPMPRRAVITPTVTRGWRSALGRMADVARAAWLAAARGLERHETLPDVDAATMRDLGLSHRPAVLTPRDRIADRRC